MKLKFKLIISFIIPIIFIIILGVVSYQKAADGIRNSYEFSTSQSIKTSGEYINIGVKAAEAFAVQCITDNTLFLYANGHYTNEPLDNVEIYNKYRKTFLAKTETDEFISNINILTANTDSISEKKLDSNIMKDFIQTKLGQYAKENPGKVVWSGSDTFLDDKLGRDYAFRYIKYFSGTDAAVIIDISKELVRTNLIALELDKFGKVGFVTSDGIEIISGQENFEKVVFTDQSFYKDAVSSEKTSDSYYVDKDGKKYLFIYSKIGDSGAMICTLIPQSVILSKADSIKNVTIILVLISSIIAIVVGSMISIGIDKMISKINQDLGKAAKGDLTVMFHSKGRDEFHTLNNEIQNTFSNMKGLIKGVKQLSNEVSAASENVAETSEEFKLSCGNISQAMKEIEQGINQQAKDAEECLLQMGGLSDKITIVSDNTKAIRQIADETQISISNGTSVTFDLNNQTNDTIGIASEIIKEIEELARKSSSVGKIVNVINDIAIQTNLLSLNASIEAARAGEYGKGFAVVAEEIRNLSEQSGKSVKDIQRIIKTIGDDIIHASWTVKKVENVMVLQKNAVDNTISSYKTINQKVDSLVSNLNDISTNVGNIEDARISTLGAVESISAVLEEIAASSNTVGQATNDLLQSVEDLNTSAANLNNNSNQLVKAVEAFNV